MRALKQVVLINGMPFEIKTIYGLEEEHDAHDGEVKVDIKDSG